jgi:coenzyme F420-reducing hydrogenase alpha subunit
MHQTFDISLEDLTKIEGHASLDLKVKKGEVKNVRLKISENRRFFELGVRGKKFNAAPQLLSRICGTCSAAHLMCSIQSIEDALKIHPSEQTTLLRDLTMYGVNIRDHAMHLYLFVLPDLFGKDSVLDFDDKGYQHELLHKAFDIKKVGNTLSTEVAGRTIHPPFPSIGHFLHVPSTQKAKSLIKELKKIREPAIEFVHLFHEKDFCFEMNEIDFIAISNKDYSYLGRGICTHSDGFCIPENDFERFFKEKVIPYSTAKGFSFQGTPYMVGALARMNINLTSLHKDTRKDLSEDNVFPSFNIYHNNLAQAIEIVHCIDASIDLLERYEFKQEKVEKIKGKKSEGVGVVEAPRGTLYHHVKMDQNENITYSNLVIPTAQNQVIMEKAIGQMVEQRLNEGKKKKAIEHEIEVLIRAFDPCMSCATHFLKVKWHE